TWAASSRVPPSARSWSSRHEARDVRRSSSPAPAPSPSWWSRPSWPASPLADVFHIHQQTNDNGVVLHSLVHRCGWSPRAAGSASSDPNASLQTFANDKYASLDENGRTHGPSSGDRPPRQRGSPVDTEGPATPSGWRR